MFCVRELATFSEQLMAIDEARVMAELYIISHDAFGHNKPIESCQWSFVLAYSHGVSYHGNTSFGQHMMCETELNTTELRMGLNIFVSNVSEQWDYLSNQPIYID